MMGGGMGGAQTASLPEPKLGEVLQIQNNAHFQKTIAGHKAVIVDFWGSYCGPCIQFKPTYEGCAQYNKNPSLVFCSVQTDKERDVAQAHNIMSVPTFHFYLNGKLHAQFTGANKQKFMDNLAELNRITGSKANDHYTMSFRQFKPQNKLPMSFTSPGHQDKMKEFIGKLANDSAKDVQVDILLTWLETFDTKSMSNDAID